MKLNSAKITKEIFFPRGTAFDRKSKLSRIFKMFLRKEIKKKICDAILRIKELA
jgi:hypothetical protein